MRSLLLVLWITLLLTSGCTAAVTPTAANPPAEGEPAAKIKLGVGYIPSVQFAPFYVGIAKGFFAEEGLDLELAHGFENDYLKLVGVGELPFMIGSGDQVVLGRGQGLPVRYVMNWYTKYPVVVFAKAEKNITRPADLKGKSVGLPGPFGANYVALRGILEAGGLTEQDIKEESIGFTQAAAISEDTVDAAVDYAVNGPVQMALQGIETTQIALDDSLAIPANGLVTNEKTIQENPQLVAKVVRAIQKSVQYTVNNPDEAFRIALKAIPEAGGANEKANRAIFDASLAYWTPPGGAPPCVTTPAAWEITAEFMQRIGLVDKSVPAADLFTNEFCPTSTQ